MVKRLKMIIIFLIGVVIAVAGMVIYLFYPEIFGEMHRAYSFVIMITGLLFVAVGAVKGKKKIADHRQNRDFFSQSMKTFYEESAKKGKQDKTQRKEERPQPAPEAVPVKNRTLFGFSRSDKDNERPKEVEMPRQAGRFWGGSEGSNESGERVVKVYICPSCASENPENHMFCSNCGKRLKPATPSKHSVGAKQTKLAKKR
jgi:hypothetical protein